MAAVTCVPSVASVNQPENVNTSGEPPKVSKRIAVVVWRRLPCWTLVTLLLTRPLPTTPGIEIICERSALALLPFVGFALFPLTESFE